MRRGLLSKLQGFRAGRDGLAAVEFALILPFMLLLLFGGFEYGRYASVSRKVTLTTRAVADLTTQYVTMSGNDMQTVLGASAQIFAPYATDRLAIVVSELSTNGAGLATVVWSKTLNGVALSPGQTVAVPPAVAQPNGFLVLCQVSYDYAPVIAAAYGPTRTISDQLYMLPRHSNSIAMN